METEPLECVVFEGGPIDGAEGTIHRECSVLDFCIYMTPEDAAKMERDEEGTIYGYFASSRTKDGHRIFTLGSKEHNKKPAI